MKQQDYSRYFKQHQQLTLQWQTLLREMVSQLGGITFNSQPHIAVNSSNGDWYGISVSSISIETDGYLVLTDDSGDVYHMKGLDGDMSLILISEIIEQTDWQFES